MRKPFYQLTARQHFFAIRMGCGGAIIGSCLAGLLGPAFIEPSLLDTARYSASAVLFIVAWMFGTSQAQVEYPD